MNKPIQIVHSDVPITYDEQANKWSFTLRGRDRSAESLAKAKEIIDKPVPAEKAKPFEKIPAWLFKYVSDVPQKVEVTGIAESNYRHTQTVWINNAKKRSKEMVVGNIYSSNEKNDALVSQIVSKLSLISELREEVLSLRSKLSPLVLPKEE